MYGLMLARQRLALAAAAARPDGPRSSFGLLTKSFLVATFFNNFLPSNIGGDVVRVADTAPFAGSKTLATTVVLVDRLLGLIALLAVAAVARRSRRSAGVRSTGIGYIWLALVGVRGGLLFVPALSRTLLARLLTGRRRGRGGGDADPAAQSRRARSTRFARQPPTVWVAFAGALVVQVLLVAVLYLRRAQPGGAAPAAGRLGHRPGQPGGPDGAAVDQRLRRPRSGVRVLLHEPRLERQLGADALARQRGADHAVLVERRRRLPVPRTGSSGRGGRRTRNHVTRSRSSTSRATQGLSPDDRRDESIVESSTCDGWVTVFCKAMQF